MSWTSPFTVASTSVPLPPSSDFSMCGSRYATALFIVSADCRTNGSCISPDANRSLTTFIPARSQSLTMSSAGLISSAAERSSSRPLRAASTMRRARRSSSGRAGELVGCRRRRHRRALEQLEVPPERVVTFASLVVDDFERDLALLVGDARQREDLRRRDDRHVEAALDGFVQVDGVENLASGSVEPERDVADPENGERARAARTSRVRSSRASRCRSAALPPCRLRSGARACRR